MAKQIFVVKVCWKTYGEHRIEAETAEDAKMICFDNDEIPDTETGLGQIEILEAVPASDPMEDGEEAP